MTMFVLSPSVAATKTSARSIPAAISASISSAVPTVKWPPRSWEDMGGRYTVGTALEIEALEEAGIAEADAFVAATDGDNTNLVIAQIAKRRFEVPTVIARILDPYRAAVVRVAGRAHDLSDPRRDRHARSARSARPPPTGPAPAKARQRGRRSRS